MNDFKPDKDNKTQLRTGYLCAIIALVLAISALGSMSVVSSCEKDARYLSASGMVTAFAIGLILAAVLSISALFIFKKERVELSASDEWYAKVARCSSLLPAALSLFVTAFAPFDSTLGEWGNAVMICGAISTLFFILKLFPRYIAATVISGFGIFALCAVIIASLYLDLLIEINSHFKLLVQFGAVGVILGTIADLRATLSSKIAGQQESAERESIKIRARGYVFLKSLALTLSAACASVIILYFIEGNTAFGAHYLVYSLLYLAYAVSVIAELIRAVLSVNTSHI